MWEGRRARAVLFREPTDDELTALLDITEKTGSDVKVYTHSVQKDFTVADNKKEEEEIEVFQVRKIIIVGFHRHLLKKSTMLPSTGRYNLRSNPDK
jgi:hypothetical protein